MAPDGFLGAHGCQVSSRDLSVYILRSEIAGVKSIIIIILV
jgi:hypothetical protein